MTVICENCVQAHKGAVNLAISGPRHYGHFKCENCAQTQTLELSAEDYAQLGERNSKRRGRSADGE
jgi:hypothetical protein